MKFKFQIIATLLFIVNTVLFIGCKSSKLSVQKIETSSTKLDKNSEEDKAFLEEISPYKAKINSEMNAVLITSNAAATKGQPESELGNLISDIILKKSNDYSSEKVDMCMLNNGGLRTSLPEGEITLGKVFELMPFENELVIITLNGRQTKRMFEYIANSGGVPLAGATAILGDSSVIDIKIGGNAFDESRSYKIATSDYLAGGGDKMRFFNNPESLVSTKHKLRDAIVDFMVEENKKGNKLNPKKDGRLKKQ